MKAGDKVRVKATGELGTIVSRSLARGRWMVRGPAGELGATVVQSYAARELELGEDLPRPTPKAAGRMVEIDQAYPYQLPKL